MGENKVVIAGVGIHQFGRFPGKSYQQLGQEAVAMALKDAGMKFRDIEAAFVGSLYLPGSAGVRILSAFGRTSIPIVDVEAQCASGGASLRQAYAAITSGMYKVVLALGVEKMPRGFMPPENIYEWWQCYAGLTQNPMYWAMNARRHMHDYGTTIQQIAKVSVKNHKNGALNPFAMYQKAMTLEEIMNSTVVCDPVRLYMICAPNEGAAATILCSKDVASRYTAKPITLAASIHRVSPHPLINVAAFSWYPTGQQSVVNLAACEAYEESGIGPKDLDCVELQDTDAFCEIESYEELQLCKRGEGGRLIDEGITEIGGKLPVNTSGGLISKGEPVGASGLGQIFEICMQLRNQAGPRQVTEAKVGLAQVFGAHGHASVTILKR